MSVSQFRLFFDNSAADDVQLDVFAGITVDQAIGMATEAELRMDIGVDEMGVWTGIDEDFANSFSRVRVEVKVREEDFVPLIDGPIVAQRFELSARPNESTMALVVQDDTVLLNQDEAVEVFEDKSADEVAEQCLPTPDWVLKPMSCRCPRLD